MYTITFIFSGDDLTLEDTETKPSEFLDKAFDNPSSGFGCFYVEHDSTKYLINLSNVKYIEFLEQTDE